MSILQVSIVALKRRTSIPREGARWWPGGTANHKKEERKKNQWLVNNHRIGENLCWREKERIYTHILLSYRKQCCTSRETTRTHIQRQRPLFTLHWCRRGPTGGRRESLIGNNEQTALDLIYYSSTSILSLYFHITISLLCLSHQTSAKMHPQSLPFVMLRRFPTLRTLDRSLFCIIFISTQITYKEMLRVA